MQSDTFLPDTDSDDGDTSSESSGDLPKNNNIGTIYKFPKDAVQGERFIDQSNQKVYLDTRNKLFTRDIETIRLVTYADNSRLSSLKLDLNGTYGLGDLKNVIGFELIKCGIKNSADSNTRPFIDLIIKEIPHKACKINEAGLHIIDRITLTSGSNTFRTHEPQRSYNNFFTPIGLSEVTIQLIDTHSETKPEVYLEGYFEFEVSILRVSLSNE